MMIGSILAPHAVTGVGAPLGASGASPTRGAAGGDFTSVLAYVAASAVDSLKAGEAAAVSGIHGGAPVQQVVESMMTAEQAMQTAIAVRDKLVAAYQEISRMAV